MSSPVNAQIVLLRPRVPVLVGTLIALNAPVQFGVCESLLPRGQLSISAYQSGLSGVTAVFECSIDQGVSWFSIPATSTFYGTTVFTGDTATIVASRYDVSGLCGSQMRWGFTVATGLTSYPVYALQALTMSILLQISANDAAVESIAASTGLDTEAQINLLKVSSRWLHK
jgi:hypothetical protein